MSLENEILDLIRRRLHANQLILPSQPEIMLSIREIIEKSDSNLTELVNTINKDPALAAQILRVANSVLYLGQKPVSNMQQAASRLGMQQIIRIANTYALSQVFSQPKGVLQDFFRVLLRHTLHVAANAYALAKQYTYLDADDAMQAGLLHDLGYLTVVPLAESFATVPTPILLDCIRKLHTETGAIILRDWNFPSSIIDAVANHENLSYIRTGSVDLTEILIVANMMTYQQDQFHPGNRNTIPAIVRTGIDPNVPLAEQKETGKDIEYAHILLGLN